MAKKETVGIVLAGGRGSRLYPSTKSISKQLLPVYDKPLIYYSLSILMLADIRKILIICAEDQLEFYENLLGDGSSIGLEISYEVQYEPKGIGEAFLIGSKFINKSNICLVLGDNILWGRGLTGLLMKSKKLIKGGRIFAYPVDNPEEFGVIRLNRANEIIEIIEKPKDSKSNLAIPGIYFYDNSVIEVAKSIKPSQRGELEITDINKIYLKKKKLNYTMLGRGFAWLDTGNPELILEASNFVRTIEKRQGTKIACLEEISYKKGWISKLIVMRLLNCLPTSMYKEYLKKLL